jgi:rhomboid protease GluP
MDISYILVWFVGLSCLWTLVNALRGGGTRRNWLYPTGTVLALTVAGYFLAPGWAGYIALGLWALLVLAPMRGFVWINRLIANGEYAKALRVSRWVRLLHPFGDWPAHDAQLKAWELARQGRWTERAALLEEQQLPQTAARSLTLQSYQSRGDWQGARAWLESFLSDEVVRQDPNLLQPYLRALGETGDLEGLLQTLQRYRSTVDSAPWASQLYMIILAFCGRREASVRLLDSFGPAYPPNVRTLWLATADLAAGNEAAGRAQLEPLQNDPQVGATTRRRLALPITPAQTLSPEAQQFLDQLEGDLDRDLAYAQRAAPARGATYATYALVAINVAVFLLELALGADRDLYVLYDMGAMVPSVVLAGAWWRLLAPMFLHANLLHLAMNMFGLYVLGRSVESRFGWWRYVILYLLSGLGAGLVVVALTALGMLPEAIYVGASGCIMGIVGAEGAIALRFWRKGRSRLASQQLGAIVFFVIAQVLFNLATPGISLAAHLGGLAVGFVIANLFRYEAPSRATLSG